MRNLIAIIGVIIIFLSVAYAAETWTCIKCGEKSNYSNFCIMCANPSPTPVPVSTPTPADTHFKKLDSKLYINATSASTPGSVLLQGDPTIIGGYITFGHYEQDNIIDNGKEPIEWLVLDVQNNRALVISKYILDIQPFYNSGWLNSHFANAAFTAKEASCIADVEDTRDGIFLLSNAEAHSGLLSDSQRFSSVTPYVEYIASLVGVQKEEVDQNVFPNCWWLTTGLLVDNKAVGVAVQVEANEEIKYRALPVKNKAGIRPAMWINLNVISASQ